MILIAIRRGVEKVMLWTSLASEQLGDLLRPKQGSMLVNPTVISGQSMPGPDFAAMRRVLESRREPEKREDGRSQPVEVGSR